MYISQLSLTNFRSHVRFTTSFSPGINVFIGENGSGKTNIVESIIYSSILDSHRTTINNSLITLGHNNAYISSTINSKNHKTQIDLELNNNKPNRAKINNNLVRRKKDLLGVSRTIFFSPEDLVLINGEPKDRRRFLNQINIQKTPRLTDTLFNYEKVLKQKNLLLKNQAPLQQIDPWSQQLSTLGGEIIAERLKTIDELNDKIIPRFTVFSKENQISIEYKTSISQPSLDKHTNTQAMYELLSKNIQEERYRGVSLIGPHKDDLLIKLNNTPIRLIASQGECWATAISLKLASFDLLSFDLDSPTLILDDVFGFLDHSKRTRLLNSTNTIEQVFITTTNLDDLKGIDLKSTAVLDLNKRMSDG